MSKQNIVETYLHKLYPQFFDQKISEGDSVKCDACGRIANIQIEGKGQMFCCGLPMRVLIDEH